MCLTWHTIYVRAENNKLFSDFKGVLAFAGKLGVEIKSEYGNDKMSAEFVSHNAKIPLKKKSELREQNYVSLMLDASVELCSS